MCLGYANIQPYLGGGDGDGGRRRTSGSRQAMTDHAEQAVDSLYVHPSLEESVCDCCTGVTMAQLIECVPNFSEARRPEVVQAIVAAITSITGVRVLDV